MVMVNDAGDCCFQDIISPVGDVGRTLTAGGESFIFGWGGDVNIWLRGRCWWFIFDWISFIVLWGELLRVVRSHDDFIFGWGGDVRESPPGRCLVSYLGTGWAAHIGWPSPRVSPLHRRLVYHHSRLLPRHRKVHRDHHRLQQGGDQQGGEQEGGDHTFYNWQLCLTWALSLMLLISSITNLKL